MEILITIVALGLVVFIHELGHMWWAKKCGVGVPEFSIGLGPKLISKQRGETLYVLRLLPFGGFVKLNGLDDDNEKAVPEETKFQNKTILQRLIVICAGSFNNIVTGYLIYILLFLFLGIPQLTSVITSISNDSPAQKAGLQTGDQVISINEEKVENVQEDMIELIHVSNKKVLNFQVKRNGEIIEKNIVPKFNKAQKKSLIGVSLQVENQRLAITETMKQATMMFAKNVKMVFKSFQLLFSGNVSFKELAGPVGIVQFASHEMQQGWYSFFQFLAMISVALGVINLFPFPILDGGHAMFLIFEGIIRRPINQRVLNVFNTAGAAVLIMVMVFVVANDIVFWKERTLFLEALYK